MEENKNLIHNFEVLSGILDKASDVLDGCNFQLGIIEDTDYIDIFNVVYLKSFRMIKDLNRIHDFVFGKSDAEKLN